MMNLSPCCLAGGSWSHDPWNTTAHHLCICGNDPFHHTHVWCSDPCGLCANDDDNEWFTVLTAVTTCYGQKLVTNMAATEKICNPSQPQKKHFCTQKWTNLTSKGQHFIENLLSIIMEWSTSVPSMLWHCWIGVRKSFQPVKNEWWGAGVVIFWSAVQMHVVQLMPLPPYHLLLC